MPLVDHRLALLFLSVLILAAGAPLAFAWARVLPRERAALSWPGEIDLTRAQDERRAAFPIVMLCFTTLSYIARLPGVPAQDALSRLDAQFLPPWPEYISLAVMSAFVLLPAATAGYSLLRRNFLRVPLIAAGGLVLILWLAYPYLMTSMLER